MKLLKLRANKESFHTIPFNSKGISLIVAKRELKTKETHIIALENRYQLL